MSQPIRVEVFVDGFNLYYGIRDENLTHTYRKVLWLDLDSFLRRYAIFDGQELAGIHFFTALPMGDAGKLARHQTYCAALASTGVDVVYGCYKEKKIYCPLCKQTFVSHEEKETDVNIALALLRGAVEDRYDKAILFSGDSDLAPAIENARDLFPQKQFQVLFPLNRHFSKRLKQVSNPTPIYQYLPCYKKCQFPDKVTLPSGETVQKPETWK